MLYNDSFKVQAFYKLHQAYLLQQKHLNRPFLKYFDLDALQLAKVSHPHLKQYLEPTIPILDFINNNINNRHYKQPNLFIYSHLPDTGKSSLFNLIADLTPNYFWPLDLWYEAYFNDTYQTIVWDEFSLKGQNPEFIKLLLAGTEIQLQKKGSQVLKRDNPLFLLASNHSLRHLVKKKIQFFCECPSNDLDLHSICNHGPTCRPNTDADSLYKALLARLHVFHIHTPLFPNGASQPELWEEYNLLLRNSAIFQDPNNKTI